MTNLYRYNRQAMLERAAMFRRDAENAPDIFKALKAIAMADDCDAQLKSLTEKIEAIEKEAPHGTSRDPH